MIVKFGSRLAESLRAVEVDTVLICGVLTSPMRWDI